MKMNGILFPKTRGVWSSMLRKLTTSVALSVLVAGSTSVCAQSDTQPAVDSGTNTAVEELDHNHSEATSHEHHVERMLELLGMPAQVNNATEEVLKLYSAKVDEGNTDPDLQRLVNAYQESLRKIVNSVLNWNSMKLSYISVYANQFSEDDVAAIISFLTSAAGQNFVTGQADAAVEIQQITKHIIEADMTESLTLLATQLREGLAKIQAAKNQSD